MTQELEHGEPSRALEAAGASLEALMERYADGDVSAFDELFPILRPAVAGSLRRWLKQDDRVDDAVQVTLLKLHTSRGRYRRGSPVLPWVLTIARNVALDRLRAKAGKEASLSEQDRDQIPAPAPAESWTEADEQEVVNAVRAAVEQLPDSARDVVRLHKLEGRPMSEVAQILGIREGAARVRAHRGYKLLAKLLVGTRRLAVSEDD